MTCTDWQDRFSDIYEGRGDQALEAAFGEHLRRCAACRAAYAEFEVAWHALDSLAEAEPAELPPGFHASLLARIEREQIESAVARRKSFRARVSDLFRGSRSPRTTVAYAAAAVCIALGVILIPNPLGQSVARHLGLGPESVIKVTQPQGQEAGPTVDGKPEVSQGPANQAMHKRSEPGQDVEIGWGTSAQTGRSIVTLTNHGTSPVSAALELLAGISPSPPSLPPGMDAASGASWTVTLPPSRAVKVPVPPLMLPGRSAVHLAVKLGHGEDACARYLFLPSEAGAGSGEAAIALPDPSATLDYVLGCVAAETGVLIVADRRFDEPTALAGRELTLDEAFWKTILPSGCSFRHDKGKQVVYIESNELASSTGGQ
jgi:hypothetical protein